MIGRKQAVSLRLSVTDLRKIKRISERLGARDSDVIRFAIKMLLVRLSPLSDPAIRGKHLMPFFLELGPELTHNFELDATRLDDILNDGASDQERVSIEDLHMLAMQGDVPAMKTTGSRAGQMQPPSGDGSDVLPVERRTNAVKRYLYDKYLNWRTPRAAGGQPAGEE